MTEAGRKVALEAPPSVTVLFRIERASVQKIRVFSPDCELDAGGLPVHWLAPVNPAESVALLSSYVKPSAGRSGSRDEPSDNAALTAIAMHAGPAASQALDRFVAPGQPDSVRKHAAFWLGAARGREGFETLRRLARNEADGAFRKELVFPISLSKEPEATDALIQLAREDKSGEVRKQALFWLGQKAGAKAVATLTDAIANDPDTAVKERAVFALSQLPKDEGVPRLIEVARTNRNPEIRKRAMFWLGQSNDPRALSFFEEILVHK
jgi:HEAT repeat protein